MSQATTHHPIPVPTKEEIEAARNEAARLIEKARAFIVLDEPFFATIMLKHPMQERFDIPTLAVNNAGTIYYNPAFVAGLTADEVKFGICHEVLHYASGHGLRRGHRDPKKWNYAGDMWINDTLKKSGFKLIPGVIDAPGSAERTVEDIYASFPPDDGKGKGKGKGNGGGQNTTGQDQSNDPIGDDLEDGDQPSQSEIEEMDAQRKIEVSEAAQVAKMKGKLPGALSDFAAATVESKVPWYDTLEQYMTERKLNDVSWARPARRYMPDFYLPTVDGVGSMGTVVLQVDISGSVSAKEIEHYNGHIKRIVEQTKPEKVHVIYTDTQVQKHEEFDKPEDVEIRFYSGGGTHMPAGYDYVIEKGIEPDVFITLTDGYTGWDEAPPFPVVNCISSDQEAPYGKNIHFDLND